MIRCFLALVVTFSLVACPVRCMAAACSAESVTSPPACACCASQLAAEMPEAPTPEMPAEEDCGCGQCVCHGAIVCEAVAIPSLIADAGLPSFAVAGLAAAINADTTRFVMASSPPPPLTGRTLRILTQSFLI